MSMFNYDYTDDYGDYADIPATMQAIKELQAESFDDAVRNAAYKQEIALRGKFASNISSTKENLRRLEAKFNVTLSLDAAKAANKPQTKNKPALEPKGDKATK